ncbi:MAG TPA: quinol:electron acceptor oxidoreductase subunit ActD [Bryobacteraceae bacterium]|nr:quinol:electron acceptor oxidoreductase subunit ActD [Bryobacteraceae bacterium]
MAGKNTAVFGIYADRPCAEAAIDTLRNAGFRNTDISVLFSDNEGTKDLGVAKETKAPEGATAGGISGGIIGGALGWLVGIGALAIPGIGPFIAAGPILAMLGGMGVGGALGGLIGALTGLGIPEYEAKRFEGRIRKGGILLSVHCDTSDWVRRAKSVLEQTGAEDISSASEERADFGATDRPLPRRPLVQERTMTDTDYVSTEYPPKTTTTVPEAKTR